MTTFMLHTRHFTRSISACAVVTGSEQLWLRQTKAAAPLTLSALARADDFEEDHRRVGRER